MLVAPQGAHSVRHDEAHEPHHARHRDRRTGEERGRDVHAAAYAVDMCAKEASRLLAEGEEIEGAPRREQDPERERDIDPHDEHRVPGRAREPTPEPQQGVPEIRRAREPHDRGGHRARERPDCHAREDRPGEPKRAYDLRRAERAPGDVRRAEHDGERERHGGGGPQPEPPHRAASSRRWNSATAAAARGDGRPKTDPTSTTKRRARTARIACYSRRPANAGGRDGPLSANTTTTSGSRAAIVSSDTTADAVPRS